MREQRTVIYQANFGPELTMAVQNVTDANNRYPAGSLYQLGVETGSVGVCIPVVFQRGNPAEFGPNGWTNEALLSVLIHRTEVLDAQFPCNENKQAIRHMRDAMFAFGLRTAERKERGVEGKQEA